MPRNPAAIQPAPVPDPALILLSLAVLQKVIAELEAVKASVRRLERGRGRPRDEGDVRVMRALIPTVAARRFSAREVHAVADGELALALVEADTDNPRAIGKLLRRCEGVAIDGWKLERVGGDRDGLVWRVLRVSSAPSTRADT